MTIGVIALRTRNNELEQVALELIGFAKNTSNQNITAILPIGAKEYNHLTEQLSQAGADKIIIVKNEKLENYSTQYYKHAILNILNTDMPDILLIGATSNGRDLAPLISASLETGLTADCTELNFTEDGKLEATRPTFGGSLMATILSRKTPQMATVRPNVFPKPKEFNDNNFETVIVEVDLNNISTNVKELNFTAKTTQTVSLTDAEIIVAGGRGLKTQENFKLLQTFAHNINAQIAVSRGIVDWGWCSNTFQVGQTGKTISPKIYIACGISGAIQHIEGMKSAQNIIVINKDADAPICKIADYQIIGDLNEILPVLVEKTRG